MTNIKNVPSGDPLTLTHSLFRPAGDQITCAIRGGCFSACSFSGRHPEDACSRARWSESISASTELYLELFKKQLVELLSSQGDSSVPQVWANLLIMILGMFAHFAHSSLITSHDLPSSSLETDKLCSILLIHIVPFN